MPYITEINSYITFNQALNKEITLQMEIESGKVAKTIIPVDNHLEAFVELINNDIASILTGYNVINQSVLDNIINNLAKELKRKIPNEITLSLSLNVAKLASMYYDMPLFKYLGGIKKTTLPTVFLNGSYPLKGYKATDGTCATDTLIKTEKIDKVKKDLPNVTVLDLYSATSSTINNLKKQYPNLKIVTLKAQDGAYHYFDILTYSTISELLMVKESFINTKFSDDALADIVVALGVEYVITNYNVINRMQEIASLIKN